MKLRWYQENAVNAAFTYRGYKARKHPLIVLPTGSGKSLVIAEIVRRTQTKWPGTRILVVTHRRELIEQNEAELKKLWPEAETGVFSAGLKRREIRPVTFAGIQSIYRLGEFFEEYRLIIVDEAHLIPNKGNAMYRQFFNSVDISILGLTATPFRLGMGMLTEGDDALFQEVIYDISRGESFVRLIEQGFLTKLVTKEPSTQLDVSEVHMRGGEFIAHELGTAVNKEQITSDALDEVVKQGEKRKHWLIFAVDIAHAESINSQLQSRGIKCEVVHSKMQGDRAKVLNAYKAGELQAIVNVDVLTTGFDHKAIDLLVLLRPTASPVLHSQMIGRGLRVAPGKENCLVMDFAGNTKRLGPVNDLHIMAPKGKGEGEAIMKTCPDCDSIVPGATRICPDCGHEFVFKTKLQAFADDAEVVKYVDVPDRQYKIAKVFYTRHIKPGKPDSLKVTYYVGLTSFSEWVCFEHNGYARKKAVAWWQLRSSSFPPATVSEALENTPLLRVPLTLTVNETKRYPEITKIDF